MSPYGNAISNTDNRAGEHANTLYAQPGPHEPGPGETSGRGAAGGWREAEDTVLVVNDEPDLVELMSLHLRKSGYRVLTAFDGREGFEVARAERPELIISDVSMPRVDGIEMCRLVRAHHQLGTTPVLLVSATRTDSESVIEGLKAGADDYLEAPYDRLHLIAKVAQLVERGRAQRELRASESEMRALFAAMTDVVLVLDSEGRYLKVAPTKPSHLYKPQADLVGKTIHETFPNEQADFFLAHVRRALSEGRQHDVKYPLHIGGAEIWFDACVSPLSRDSVLWVARDVTARRHAEEALRESEERYRPLFESNPQPMWVYDLETLRFLAVNEAAVRHYGYSREEFLSMTVRDIRPPEDIPALMENVTNVRGGLDETGTWRHLKKDGSRIDVEITSHELMFADRRAELVLANDVTERKRAVSELAESEERYRCLADSSFDGVVIHQDGVIKEVNRAMAEMFGHTTGELIGRNILEFIPPEQRDFVRSKIATSDSICESLGLRKDGTYINIECSPTNCLYRGRPARLIAMRDITERKRAERELRRSEERYRDLVENAHDLIYTHDLEGNYTSINKAVERTTGYTREEALRLNLAQTVAPEHLAKAREMTDRKLAGERVTAYELDIISKSGRRITVEVNTELVFEGGAPVGVQGIARDVTERKELEDQLRQSQKMEAVGKLAGGIAHDFNNLLTVINGYSDLAIRRLPAESNLRRNVEEIRKAGERAAGLTRQLLAFSRKQVLQPKVLDLNEVVRETEKMLRRLIGEDIELRAALGPGLGSVKADPGQMEQVLMNLAVNARDAMPRGGKLTIETSNVYLDEEYAAHHVAVAPGRYVMLTVSDTGSGMDEQTRARIFEPFFTTKEAGKGTGLGLSTVYGIVKQSGGHLWVYSEVGKGTTFKIYLPRVDEGERELRQSPEAGEHLGGTETVLLTEDEEVVRGLARQVLEMYGYRVLEAADGDAALSACERHAGPIHLLITDIVMPAVGGPELARRLTGLRPEMKVLFMSGYTDDAIVHHGVLEEGVNFIQKPFAPDALARKVREVLDKN